MDLFSVIQLVSYSTLFVCFTACGFLMLFSLSEDSTVYDFRMRKILTLYYFLTSIYCYLITICPSVENIHALFLFPLFINTFSYNYVYTLTCISNKDKFNLLHYLVLIPVFVAIDLLEFDKKAIVCAYLLSTSFYLYFIIRRFIRYNKTGVFKEQKIKQAKQRERSVCLLFVLFSLISMQVVVYPKLSSYSVFLLLCVIVLAVIVNLSLVYHLVSHNYNLLSAENNIISAEEVHELTEEPEPVVEEQTEPEVVEVEEPENRLNKKDFDQYLKKNKPYLNPDFKLTDLMEVFETNRTYLSNFVNKKYKMNFSYYINRLRYKELKRRQKLISNRKKTLDTMIKEVGFGSMRNYLRTKRQFERPKNE